MQNVLKKIKAGDWAVMGILNVTPDSFSDGGKFNQVDMALTQALKMQQEGASIIDVGGESTRPGAKAVTVEQELARVIPVIEKIRDNSDIAISIDTSKAVVMEAAIKAGASLVNDVNALQAEGALAVCAKQAVAVCLMHKQGTPKTMQHNPQYHQVVEEVKQFLLSRATACLTAGIEVNNVIIDPGFGFGKSLENNLDLLKNITQFAETNYTLLVGLSRKSLFGDLLNRSVEQRLVASTAAALLSYQQGAKIFRVHDVAQTCDALQMGDIVKQ